METLDNYAMICHTKDGVETTLRLLPDWKNGNIQSKFHTFTRLKKKLDKAQIYPTEYNI